MSSGFRMANPFPFVCLYLLIGKQRFAFSFSIVLGFWKTS